MHPDVLTHRGTIIGEARFRRYALAGVDRHERSCPDCSSIGIGPVVGAGRNRLIDKIQAGSEPAWVRRATVGRSVLGIDTGLGGRAHRRDVRTGLRNPALASPEVNRFQRSGKDAGEGLPDRNRGWFAGRVVEVQRVYGLSVNREEAAAHDSGLCAADPATRKWFAEE